MNLFDDYIDESYRALLTFPDPEGYANGTTFPDPISYGQLSDGGGVLAPFAVSKIGLNVRPGSTDAKTYVAANPASAIMRVQMWNGSAYADIHTWDNAGLQTISGSVQFASGNSIDTSGAASLSFGAVNATTVNIGTAAANTNINIGTSGTNTIQIGNSNSTVNILGTVLYENVTNLQVSDKLITLNKGGAAASAAGAGIELEENGSITGYIKTTGGRDGYLFRAPANAADTSFIFTSTSARTVTFQDASGTVAYTTDLAGFLKNNVGISGGTTLIGGTAASETLTLSTTSNGTKGKILFGTSAYDEVLNRLGLNSTSPSSLLDLTTNALGVTQTTTSGLALVNTTAAAAGAQQISPAIRWSGSGWKTVATAASQATDFRAYLLPIQDTTAPNASLRYESSINGGAYTSRFSINSGGDIYIPGRLAIGAMVDTGFAGSITFLLTGNQFTTGNTTLLGNVAIGNMTPTAYVHLKAGTATASTAPIKFTSGANLTAAEAGAMEFNGTQLFFTPSTTRNIVAQVAGDTALTASWVPFAGANGYLAGSALFTWDNVAKQLLADGSIKTEAPAGGTAAFFKIGSVTGGLVALDAANYLEFESGGITYKIGLVV